MIPICPFLSLPKVPTRSSLFPSSLPAQSWLLSILSAPPTTSWSVFPLTDPGCLRTTVSIHVPLLLRSRYCSHLFGVKAQVLTAAHKALDNLPPSPSSLLSSHLPLFTPSSHTGFLAVSRIFMDSMKEPFELVLLPQIYRRGDRLRTKPLTQFMFMVLVLGDRVSSCGPPAHPFCRWGGCGRGRLRASPGTGPPLTRDGPCVARQVLGSLPGWSWGNLPDSHFTLPAFLYSVIIYGCQPDGTRNSQTPGLKLRDQGFIVQFQPNMITAAALAPLHSALGSWKTSPPLPPGKPVPISPSPELTPHLVYKVVLSGL